MKLTAEYFHAVQSGESTLCFHAFNTILDSIGWSCKPTLSRLDTVRHTEHY